MCSGGSCPFQRSLNYITARYLVASIWGCRRFAYIKAVHNRALRFLLGVGRYMPNAAVNGDTGWDAVFRKQWQCVMSQWCRIKVMDQSRLNHRIYQWSVGRYMPNAAVNGDTGWDAVFRKQWQCVMSQWCRIKVMDQSRLNHRIYQWSVNYGNFRSKNWPYRIKQMIYVKNPSKIFYS